MPEIAPAKPIRVAYGADNGNVIGLTAWLPAMPVGTLEQQLTAGRVDYTTVELPPLADQHPARPGFRLVSYYSPKHFDAVTVLAGPFNPAAPYEGDGEDEDGVETYYYFREMPQEDALAGADLAAKWTALRQRARDLVMGK